MGAEKARFWKPIYASFVFALLTTGTQCATNTLTDILNLNTQTLQRVPRDNKYYLSRYGSGSGAEDSSRTIKPEDSPEARQVEPGAVEKRCTRCNDYDRYDRYDSRSRYSDDRYDTRRSRYPDYDYDRYDRYDRGYDRYDRYDSRYDRYDSKSYDRYDRDRYDAPRDRYDTRDRYYDRYDNRDRYQDRGIGYDNRGYDYRGYDRGYDRGYGPRPDTYGSGYASSWNYGGGRGDDYYKDRGGYRDQGNHKHENSTPGADRYGGYRSRDPYDVGYRGTSYLYGRPSTTTTVRSSSQDDNSVTDSPQQTNSPSG